MTDPVPSRLERRLTTGDAVVIGLGSMLGAGVFAAAAPAAEAAGSGMLIGLGIAAAVAACNATSSAQLAALHPSSGGTYVYGREHLGAMWGHLAGWSFVVGKTASCAAMALTAGAHAWPGAARPAALAAVVTLATINYHGVRKTAWATRLAVAIVLATLTAFVAGATLGGSASFDKLGPPTGGARGAMASAGVLFFAFAGYARVATLGEEVVDPARTIPRAIPVALGITLSIYAAVLLAALAAAGPDVLARSDAPLVAAVEQGSAAWLAGPVRVGATVAALGVLVSLLAGVGRTVFAMAANRDLPGPLAAVHPRHRVPHRAEAAVAVLVVATVAVADVRGAIGFSSFCVLAYYALTNAAALTLPEAQRRWRRGLAVAGLIGCVAIAVMLPAESVRNGVVVLAVGAVISLRHQTRPDATTDPRP